LVPDEQRWNGNIHLLRRLLRRVPPSARRGLDVGCGEGVTTRLLRPHVETAIGIDEDAESLELARSQGGDVGYARADLLRAPFPDGAFDVVSAVAVLHHGDLEPALRRLRALLAPGGVLLVVGFARNRSPLDYAYALAGTIWLRRHMWFRGSWETPSPKRWDFELTYAETAAVCRRVLPGCAFRRDPLFRFTLTWVSPTA
jgi:SAM-dependent methyltransferase